MDRDLNATAILIFGIFVATTLAITVWAYRRVKSRSDYYAAGHSITPIQNGFAIAGDYLSAASFLGTTALFFAMGVDGLIYAVGAVAGWPIIMFLIAERLRNLGSFTFADVLAIRLNARPMRCLAAIATLCIGAAYLTAQMVAIGTLVQILFALPYAGAVILAGILMTIYVLFGGMVATTWIQIVKAVILIGCCLFIAVAVLLAFDFDLGSLIASAKQTHPHGELLLFPAGTLSDPITAISLALAFALGPAGMPHVLMRFFTVRDGVAARQSAFFATGLIATFQLLVIVVGLGAIALIAGNAAYQGPDGSLAGGANMAAVHLAHFIGGDVLFGIVAAVAFTTILAVVSGLTLSAASAVSHDLYGSVFRHGNSDETSEIRVFRIAVISIASVAVGLGLLFEGENVGFLATLPLAIAASVNFPLLLLAMYWRGLTSQGAIWGGGIALVVSIVLVILSPRVWVSALGFDEAIYPYDYPTLITVSLAFFIAWAVSRMDHSAQGKKDRAAFMQVQSRAELGDQSTG